LETAPQKPCLVDTGRGFSVSYNNKLLYSKYDPKKNIVNLVNSLNLLPGTLIIAASPLLWYGLEELVQKLPKDCYILGIEQDKNLFEIAESELNKIISQKPQFSDLVKLIPPQKTDYIVNIVSGINIEDEYRIPQTSNFRRAILIEFSGGTLLNKPIYQNAALMAQNTIGSFWKNRLTLTKLGRLYSRNIFKNFGEISQSINLKKLCGTIDKPVFVFGAGESTVETLKIVSKEMLKKCFTIAVDAAVPILSQFGIVSDAVVAVEGQLAIEKAYIGSNKIKSLVFADFTSRNSVLRHFSKKSFFISDFTQANFLERIKKEDFSPLSVPPLGSVGLTATYLALLLRKNTTVPVFLTGLDFSYSLGKTHGQNAPAHIARLTKSNRFNPIENYAASFKDGAIKTTELNGTTYFTDIALSNYAKSFADQFSKAQNLFNCTDFGLNIGLPFVNAAQLNEYLSNLNKVDRSEVSKLSYEDSENEQNQNLSSAKKFLEAEEKALNRIKELLMFGKDVEMCGVPLEQELNQLISQREYLFLHFPDGYRCNTADLSFLKRVRSEVDFFLKDIKGGISKL
ncbi:MAG: DUF115 domain-containing protein, partial [Treponema sp.]|nr:DUF115 domain-containing protein [Candidatus Treponema equifaecale]